MVRDFSLAFSKFLFFSSKSPSYCRLLWFMNVCSQYTIHRYIYTCVYV